MDENLVFLHLSDIHFKKKETLDLDKDIRNELEKDIETLISELGIINGILITGDIAYSGKIDEYGLALDWLDNLCKKINCPIGNVWSVPGNHDVDWDVIDSSKSIRLIHNALMDSDSNNLDFAIEEFLIDSDAKEMLYRSIRNYINEFASKINCQIDAKNPSWLEDFRLNDGSILRIRGINSTLVSYNNDAESSLIVGKFQSTIGREDGVEYLIMCHHPYQWLMDRDHLNDHWQNRAKIQLFGHKHRHRITRLNDSLIVASGAMHPDRREPNWIPSYNALKIYVNKEGEQRNLNIEVFPRVWKDATQGFQSETTAGKNYSLYSFPIDEWDGPQSLEKEQVAIQDGEEDTPQNGTAKDHKPEKEEKSQKVIIMDQREDSHIDIYDSLIISE